MCTLQVGICKQFTQKCPDTRMLTRQRAVSTINKSALADRHELHQQSTRALSQTDTHTSGTLRAPKAGPAKHQEWVASSREWGREGEDPEARNHPDGCVRPAQRALPPSQHCCRCYHDACMRCAEHSHVYAGRGGICGGGGVDTTSMQQARKHRSHQTLLVSFHSDGRRFVRWHARAAVPPWHFFYGCRRWLGLVWWCHSRT